MTRARVCFLAPNKRYHAEGGWFVLGSLLLLASPTHHPLTRVNVPKGLRSTITGVAMRNLAVALLGGAKLLNVQRCYLPSVFMRYEVNQTYYNKNVYKCQY